MIRLNLLAEERAQLRARAADPVRMAALGGVGLIMVATVVGVVFYVLAQGKRQELSAKKSLWAKKELEMFAAQAELDELALLQKKQTTIQKVRFGRFLYAPQLQAIKESIPSVAQLTKLSFTWESVKIRNPDLDDPRKVAAAAERKKKLPPEVTRNRMRLTLSGYMTGEDPEQTLNAFVALLNREQSNSGGGVLPLAKQIGFAELKNYKKITGRRERVGKEHVVLPDVVQFDVICRYPI